QSYVVFDYARPHVVSFFITYVVIVTPQSLSFDFFFFNAPAPTEIYTLSLHDALPICPPRSSGAALDNRWIASSCASSTEVLTRRSEEHTSELQSRSDLVCRLLLEKKKN